MPLYPGRKVIYGIRCSWIGKSVNRVTVLGLDLVLPVQARQQADTGCGVERVRRKVLYSPVFVQRVGKVQDVGRKGDYLCFAMYFDVKVLDKAQVGLVVPGRAASVTLGKVTPPATQVAISVNVLIKCLRLLGCGVHRSAVIGVVLKK